MSESKQYKCVNCGEVSSALYKTYGPTVLKLNKCENCKGIVDKYIEYDPVIVMIDLVLISKEAQRHVLYNTDFKAYWKLFIVLMLLETYGIWRNDSLFSIAVNSLCGIDTPSTNITYIKIPINISRMPLWEWQCNGWRPELKGDDNDLFIWEKNFYIQFLSTFSGILVFMLAIHSQLNLLSSYLLHNYVCGRLTVKAFSLGNVSLVLALPMLVWGTPDTPARTRTLHYALAAAYTFLVFVSVFTVVYKCPVVVTAAVVVSSACLKSLVVFHVTPYLRAFVS